MFGAHDHAGRRQPRAGRVHAGLALDLDQAEPARARGRQPRIVAEMRDVDAVGERDLEDGLALVAP